LVIAAKTMVSFSYHIFDLAADNHYLGHGDEGEDNSAALELFKKVSFDLQRPRQQVKSHLKNDMELP
jgi:hypothetical protein